MKTKILIISTLVLVFSLSLFYSCSKNDELNLENDVTKKSNIEMFTLKERSLLGDNIYLPIGTKWYYTNESKNEVKFVLPEDYKFLINVVNQRDMNPTFELTESGAGYSCSCSKSGSCTVFYNKDVGHGCLHSTCTGTCTGSRSLSNRVIEGIVYMKNDKIDIDSNVKSSLSDVGLKGLMSLDVFQNEIKQMYDILYKYNKKPNFDHIEKNNNKEFAFAKVYLFGVELGIIIPNDKPTLEKYLKDMSVTSLEEAPRSCSCSGGNQGGSCKLEKQGMFGYVAYYCTGCQTCTMN